MSDNRLRIDVDLNSRAHDGTVRAGFENTPTIPSVREHVVLVESDDGLIVDAVVERIDSVKRLLYMRAIWITLRDDGEELLLVNISTDASGRFDRFEVDGVDYIAGVSSGVAGTGKDGADEQ